MNLLFRVFLKPLLATVAIEAAGAFCLGVRAARDLALVALINLITNPLINLAALLLRQSGFLYAEAVIYLLLEPLVVLVEYLLYRAHLESGIRPFRLALLLNAFSAIGGLLWGMLF